MVRKKTNKEWTTMQVQWEVKEELLTHAIGRETDNEVLRRVLKMHKTKVKKHKESKENKEYEEKLNRPKKARRR